MSPPGTDVIDVHAHLFLPELFELLNDLPQVTVPIENGRAQNLSESWTPISDVEDRLRTLDELGIDRQVISVSGVENFVRSELMADPERRAEISRHINDGFATVLDDHGDRFGAFADVPLVAGGNVDAAREEAERAVEDLGFDGVTCNTNVGGVRLDDERFEPLLETIDRLDVPIFMHPANPVGEDEAMADPHKLRNLVGYPNETALAATRLAFRGLLDRYDLTVIAPHLGGTLPFLGYRNELCFDEAVPSFYHDGRWAESLEKTFIEYVTDHFYLDTGLVSAEQMSYTHDVFGDRIVFGTDQPWFPPTETPRIYRFIEEAELPERAVSAIYHGNARSMLS